MTIVCVNTSAQDYSDYDELFKNAEAALYSQPDEAIKIAEHVIQNSTNPTQLIHAHLLNSVANYVKGEYNKAVKAGVEAKILAEAAENIPMQLKATVASIHILSHLDLNAVAEQYYINTSAPSETLKTQEANLLLKGEKALLEAYKSREKNQWLETLEYFTEANSYFKKIPDNIMVNETTIAMAEIYAKVYDPATTQTYLEKLLEKEKEKLEKINYLEIDKQNQWKETPLHFSIQVGNLYLISILFEKSSFSTLTRRPVRSII